MSTQKSKLQKSPLTLAEIEELEQLVRERDGLPHIHGFPWYKWAKDYHDYDGPAAFLCSANQISKSSTQIRTAINWATDKTLWKKLWPGLLPGQIPNQFWYFYPTYDTWMAEFESKWVPDFLPRNEYKDHPIYGWKEEYDKSLIKKIYFNSGVTIYCKAYGQKIKDLQSGSVHALFIDEEPPDFFMPELQARLRATNGKIRAVMTPTIAQEYWRRVFEPKNKEEEIYPDAYKRQISLYDAQVYLSGKKSRWTDARIKQIINECGTESEVQRRVFGRFVKSEGLKFESFDLGRNMSPKAKIPNSWSIYSAVDPGSGGKSGHPAAMVFIAVRPDYREGVIFRARRMDGIPTANPDILQEYRNQKQDLMPIQQLYDYKDKDFYLIALGQGETFIPANKARDEGFGLMNSLFKNGMLKIHTDDPELAKLVTELQSLPAKTDSRKKDTDDLSDATRYCCMAIPWDFSHLATPPDLSKFQDPKPDQRTESQIIADQILKDRREFTLNKTSNKDDISQEFEYWNDMMGSGNE